MLLGDPQGLGWSAGAPSQKRKVIGNSLRDLLNENRVRCLLCHVEEALRRHLHYARNGPKRPCCLRTGQLDLALGPINTLTADLACMPLLEDPWLCAVGAGARLPRSKVPRRRTPGRAGRWEMHWRWSTRRLRGWAGPPHCVNRSSFRLCPGAARRNGARVHGAGGPAAATSDQVWGCAAVRSAGAAAVSHATQYSHSHLRPKGVKQRILGRLLPLLRIIPFYEAVQCLALVLQL